jgi:hypothetical protein
VLHCYVPCIACFLIDDDDTYACMRSSVDDTYRPRHREYSPTSRLTPQIRHGPRHACMKFVINLLGKHMQRIITANKSSTTCWHKLLHQSNGNHMAGRVVMLYMCVPSSN